MGAGAVEPRGGGPQPFLIMIYIVVIGGYTDRSVIVQTFLFSFCRVAAVGSVAQ